MPKFIRRLHGVKKRPFKYWYLIKGNVEGFWKLRGRENKDSKCLCHYINWHLSKEDTEIIHSCPILLSTSVINTMTIINLLRKGIVNVNAPVAVHYWGKTRQDFKAALNWNTDSEETLLFGLIPMSYSPGLFIHPTSTCPGVTLLTVDCAMTYHS